MWIYLQCRQLKNLGKPRERPFAPLQSGTRALYFLQWWKSACETMKSWIGDEEGLNKQLIGSPSFFPGHNNIYHHEENLPMFSCGFQKIFTQLCAVILQIRPSSSGRGWTEACRIQWFSDEFHSWDSFQFLLSWPKRWMFGESEGVVEVVYGEASVRYQTILVLSQGLTKKNVVPGMKLTFTKW